MTNSLDFKSKTILITGSCGFIGFHCAMHFLDLGYNVIGIDNMYIDENSSSKKIRLHNLTQQLAFEFHEIDIKNLNSLEKIFLKSKVDFILHLAAKTGVRKSEENFVEYLDSNVKGTRNVLECSKTKKIPVIYASSSSVYGVTDASSFVETQDISSPKSIYALTKISCENLAYYYQKKYDLNIIGLRFFTVYGILPRLDMAIWKFISAIDTDQKVKLYNHGQMYRDFTFVDDIVNSIDLFVKKMTVGQIIYKNEIFNIGNGSSILISDLLSMIETKMEKKAKIINSPDLFEDLPYTKSDNTKLFNHIGYKPTTSISEGLDLLLAWHNSKSKTFSFNILD